MIEVTLDVIIALALMFGGFYFLGWVISQVSEYFERQRSKLRSQIAHEVFDNTTINKEIALRKQKFESLGYESNQGCTDWNSYLPRKRYSELLGRCPSCQEGYLRIIDGKYGKFIGCSKFPSCGFTKNLDKAKTEYREEINNSIISDIREAYK